MSKNSEFDTRASLTEDAFQDFMRNWRNAHPEFIDIRIDGRTDAQNSAQMSLAITGGSKADRDTAAVSLYTELNENFKTGIVGFGNGKDTARIGMDFSAREQHHKVPAAIDSPAAPDNTEMQFDRHAGGWSFTGATEQKPISNPTTNALADNTAKLVSESMERISGKDGMVFAKALQENIKADPLLKNSVIKAEIGMQVNRADRNADGRITGEESQVLERSVSDFLKGRDANEIAQFSAQLRAATQLASGKIQSMQTADSAANQKPAETGIVVAGVGRTPD